MDIFDSKLVSPMLMHERRRPFDDSRYIYEERYGGERCLAYLDSGETRLVCSRNFKITDKFPELLNLHQQVRGRCILDGELVIKCKKYAPLEAFKKRIYTTNRFLVWLASRAMPAVFVAFDILYHLNRQITQFPLIARKKLLEEVVRENHCLALSKFVEQTGVAFFETVKARKLMGVVAKKKSGPYYMGEHSRDWIVIKNQIEDDFIICGYSVLGNRIRGLALGKYSRSGKMIFKGFVPVRLPAHDAARIMEQAKAGQHPFTTEPPRSSDELVWLEPRLVCTVGFVDVGVNGTLQGSEYSRLREDKPARLAVDRGRGMAYV